MPNKAILIAALVLCLAASAASQGYMGTVSTGTGILPPITVGKSTNATSSLGAVSSLENLSGAWSLDLRGERSRHFELQVIQRRDLLAGSGQMSDGQGSQAVTVAGSVTGGNPTIYISAIDTTQVFRVKLSHSGGSLAGEYDSLSANERDESGTATGRLTLTAPSGQATALGVATNPSATEGAYVGSAARSIS